MPLIAKLLARWVLGTLGTLLSLSIWADGTLTHMSGQVSVRKTDGTSPIGRVGLKVVMGDTVLTGASGYVRMEMTDGSEIVLRPNSEMRINDYKYSADKPAEDKFSFNMVKGGLRTVTGLIGKRGNKDAYEMRSLAATIGIRGTQFDVRICDGGCGSLADGTYAAVRTGAIQVTNTQGSVPVAAGQVVYAPVQQAPVILPRDPGIGFTPPATIPKLDEKKKVQSNQSSTTTQQSPQASGGGSGQSSQTTASGQQQRSSTTQGASQDGKSQSTSATSSSEGTSSQASGSTATSSTDAGGGATGGTAGGAAGGTTGSATATSSAGGGQAIAMTGSTGGAASDTSPVRSTTTSGNTTTASPQQLVATPVAAAPVVAETGAPVTGTSQLTNTPAQLTAPNQSTNPQGVECVVQ